jgi:hypothetical protein
MAKKSRKTAAKYSELGKLRRKRQLTKPGPQSQVVAKPQAQEAAATGTKKSSPPPRTSATQRGARTQPGIRVTVPDYKYVRDDLKRVGILAGVCIAIIIILAFVLR